MRIPGLPELTESRVYAGQVVGTGKSLPIASRATGVAQLSHIFAVTA
ncbi:MAG TPA: hypothetical protein VJV79_15925 [Polyangiaceae bacterium]|nr:hypothetical protein [Polyangiaceae bacterium]